MICVCTECNDDLRVHIEDGSALVGCPCGLMPMDEFLDAHNDDEINYTEFEGEDESVKASDSDSTDSAPDDRMFQ